MPKRLVEPREEVEEREEELLDPEVRTLCHKHSSPARHRRESWLSGCRVALLRGKRLRWSERVVPAPRRPLGSRVLITSAARRSLLTCQRDGSSDPCFEGALDCAPQERRTFNRITGMTDGERDIIASAGEWEAKNSAESQQESPEERSIRAFDIALDEWFGEDLAKVSESHLGAYAPYSTRAVLLSRAVRHLDTPQWKNQPEGRG